MPSLSPKRLSKIQECLEPTDYLSEFSVYQKLLGSYLAGTALWIQQTRAYTDWYESQNHGILWIKGDAGAGKSVFAAMVAAQIASTKGVAVPFFFFDQSRTTSHHLRFLVRDFISQLLDLSPFLQIKARDYIGRDQAIDNLSLNELSEVLVEGLSGLTRSYCIIDALDGMDTDQEIFLRDLVALGKSNPSSIKILITSRSLPRINRIFNEPSILQIELETRQTSEDIAAYVEHRLIQHPKLDDGLRRYIKNQIGKNEHGSFLFARLILDHLTSQYFQSIPEIKRLQYVQNWFPNTLQDLYNGLLLEQSRRSGAPQDLQMLIFQWITLACHPIRLQELETVLDHLKGQNGQDTAALILAACGPLVEIGEEGSISVIHSSVKEFLTDRERKIRKTGNINSQFPSMDTFSTHHLISVASLKYLNSGCFSDWEISTRRLYDGFNYGNSCCISDKVYQSFKLRHPFLEYAINNLLFHVCRIGYADKSLFTELDAFIQPSSHNFRSWLDISWQGTDVSKTSSLHIAARHGMRDYALYLIEKYQICDSLDVEQRTPLSWAAEKGHTEVVALLLKNNAHPDSDNWVGLKSMHFGARENHHKIVRILLDAGVSPLTPKTKHDPGGFCGWSSSSTTKGDTPVLYACKYGSMEALREMIPYLGPEDLSLCLYTASKFGKTRIVELLLTAPNISVEPPDIPDSPLFIASSRVYLDIMCALVKSGADPMRRCWNHIDKNDPGSSFGKKPRSTPLHAICSCSALDYSEDLEADIMIQGCQLLLNAGCEINATDENGKTPLHCSIAQFSHYRALDILSILLLEHGANPTIKDNKDNTALHLLRLNKSSGPVIEALISKGADINARRYQDGRTPIHTMLSNYYHRLYPKVLVPFVKNWNIKDLEGNTPLHLLVSNSACSDKALRDMIEAGSDIGARNNKGEVALHLLGNWEGKKRVMLQSLLQLGADIEAKDNQGRTLLLRNLSDQSKVEVLLEMGASVVAEDNDGNNALHLLCQDTQKTRTKTSLPASRDTPCNETNPWYFELNRI